MIGERNLQLTNLSGFLIFLNDVDNLGTAGVAEFRSHLSPSFFNFLFEKFLVVKDVFNFLSLGFEVFLLVFELLDFEVCQTTQLHIQYGFGLVSIKQEFLLQCFRCGRGGHRITDGLYHFLNICHTNKQTINNV